MVFNSGIIQIFAKSSNFSSTSESRFMMGYFIFMDEVRNISVNAQFEDIRGIFLCLQNYGAIAFKLILFRKSAQKLVKKSVIIALYERSV